MKSLGIQYKLLLNDIASEIQKAVFKTVRDSRVIKTDIEVLSTNTLGWCTDILKFKGISGRGRIMIWLDQFPNIDQPILSICFWSSDIQKLKKLALENIKHYSDTHPTKCKKVNSHVILEKPLTRKHFQKYLLEPYETKYISYYLLDEIGLVFTQNKAVKKKATNEIIWLSRAVTSTLGLKVNVTSSAMENKRFFTTHLRRERDSQLAFSVKVRDGFICRVCDFNFEKWYGDYGRNFAEAHHIIPLAILDKEVKTKIDDMITVCSNCHRILHKMEGKKNDYRILRNIVYKGK